MNSLERLSEMVRPDDLDPRTGRPREFYRDVYPERPWKPWQIDIAVVAICVGISAAFVLSVIGLWMAAYCLLGAEVGA